MYVIAIHEVSDPDAFWSGPLDLPNDYDAVNENNAYGLPSLVRNA